MASSSSLRLPLPLLLLIFSTAALLLTSPATSQTCRSQTFPNTNTTYANCTDLPTLRAQLHWTYDPSARPNPTLSIAFVAPPARPNGWVAWALNPTRPGMLGAQALVAFADPANGSAVVRTYNITSYDSISESRIAYEVLSRRAEIAGGLIRIFATLAVPPPAEGAAINQVWQVGPAVSAGGVPARHDLEQGNLNSRGTLALGGGTAARNRDAPPAASGGVAPPAPRTQGGNDSSGVGGSLRGEGLGLYGALVLLGALLF